MPERDERRVGDDRTVGVEGDVDDDGIVDGRVLDAFDMVEFTDDELTQLALDADPFDPFDPDVTPLDERGRTGFHRSGPA